VVTRGRLRRRSQRRRARRWSCPASASRSPDAASAPSVSSASSASSAD
jgi:hypothetical protein